MTKEEKEAIKVIKEHCYFNNLVPEAKEALDKLIKASEQEPCNNAIDRQTVLDIINFEDKWLFDAKSHNEDTKIAFSAMKSQITKMPPVRTSYEAGYNDAKREDATFALEAKITKDNIGVSERTKGWNEACQAISENIPTIIEAESEEV